MAEHPIILIVDDYDDGRDVLSLQLRLSGYRVMSTGGMEAALALARTVRFDLYILEHRLKDGSRFAKLAGASAIEEVSDG